MTAVVLAAGALAIALLAIAIGDGTQRINAAPYPARAETTTTALEA